MQEEIWKPVPGYEGLYEVSNQGRVRSLDRKVLFRDFYVTKKGEIKKQLVDRKGYYYVFLSKNGVERTQRVHRLVAEAFIVNPDNKPAIDHINTIRTDNRVENLRWVTAQENVDNELSRIKQKSAWTKELVRKVLDSKIKNGSKTAPKKVYQFTIQGEFVAEYESSAEAKRALGTTVNISVYVDKENRTACGFLWRSTKEKCPQYKGRMKYFKLRNIQHFDKHGNLIAEYKDVKEAAEKTGIKPGCIRRSIYKDFSPTKYKFKLKDDT